MRVQTRGADPGNCGGKTNLYFNIETDTQTRDIILRVILICRPSKDHSKNVRIIIIIYVKQQH